MIKITKHKNNKLYVPDVHRYTNLTEIKSLVQSGEKIQVTEDSTGADVTAQILSQVLQRTGNVSVDKLAELIRRGE